VLTLTLEPANSNLNGQLAELSAKVEKATKQFILVSSRQPRHGKTMLC